MQRLALAVAAALPLMLVAPPNAGASDASDITAVIGKFNDAATRADLKAYTAYCTNDAVIVDRIPPYVFRGPHACEDDWNAVVGWENQNGIVDGGLKISKPQTLIVSGDRGYAVVPVTVPITHHGKKTTELANWIFSLRRLPAGWRITGWAYAVLKAPQ
jgi:ketosteroid isomerase-like protein